MSKYDEKILEKLTLVICSYNRHKYLKRTIRYWSRLKIKLVIIDGSDQKLKDPCLEANNVQYIYEKKSFYERLLNSINYIETEFMMLGCDDEFYLPSSLIACIKFLSNEPSFSSCGGRALGFFSKKNNLFGIEQYPKLKNIILDHDSFSERVEKHFSNYVPAHMYSVIRSKKWKIICKCVFSKEYSFFAAMELQIEFLIMVSGKSKILPNLMWMRNKEVPGIRGTGPSMSESMTIYNWWHEKKYEKEKDDFLYSMKITSEKLLRDKNFKIYDGLISKLFETYIHKFLDYKLSRKFLKKLKKFIPNFIKAIMKSVFLNMINTKKIRQRTLIEEANILEAEGVYVNYRDLNQIISHLK